MHGASGRQILGQRAPLAAGAQNVHHAVDHLADSDAPFAAAGLARRDQRLDMRPFRIGQVARITQFVAVVARAVAPWPAVPTWTGSSSADRVKGFVVQPRRWVVERTIAWLNRCRRLAKDWENLNRNALAFIKLASIRLMLRKLCNPT